MTSRPEQTVTAPPRGRGPNGRPLRLGGARVASASGARDGQRGYALVALLAVMAIIAIMMTAAAPRMQQQAQRELEKESIARGEEVAAAIFQFAADMRRLPTSMDELVNGYTPPGTFKTVYPLRKSAARDPLVTTRDGEWKLVRQTDRVFADFVADVAKYNGGTLPAPMIYRGFLGGQPPQISNVIDLNKDEEEEEPPGGEDNESNVSGPFIGVVGRSRRKAVLHYYGIERHDRWIFTPYFR